MTTQLDDIRTKLIATFSPTECLLQDESAMHAGHAGAASGGSHYRLRLISEVFEGKNRLNRHRLVYDCLDDMMQHKIHALAITALAPSEIKDA
ncbi:BolA family protein [Glaciimonas sp. GNP009]|uniref:BolA family protein n=1 Tax=unclassified Glaciimonas TaxID=2644401 RepID=UPI002AB4322C|nr:MULTISPECIES: BolA family protein [unclassified Glaciimonas]MDY7548222.1 BolA family protein [Glaciimonas sp. CA11.2]MEB0010629.1 BolA family protein [Glaciimonas sp. Cout2]